MAEGRTAAARLERLLYLLPAASREGGAALGDLAAALDAPEALILEDLEEVTARVYYHPGGWPDDVQILVEPDRVRVLQAGGLERPPRLSPRETLCLALALRGTRGASGTATPEARGDLLARAERHLGQVGGEDDARALAAPDHEPDSEGHRDTLLAAARGRRAVAIVYLKPAAEDVEARVIEPYAMVYAEGKWYAVGHCRVAEGVRLFRVDRVIEAAPTDDTFTVPDDFDPAHFVERGRVYRAEAEIEVRVRYSPAVARWIRERAEHRGDAADEADEADDGSVTLTHTVADPHWIVHHTLQYGAEAEVVEPEQVRAMVREVAEGTVHGIDVVPER